MKRNLQNDDNPVAGQSFVGKNKYSNIVPKDQSRIKEPFDIICLSDSDEEVAAPIRKDISNDHFNDHDAKFDEPTTSNTEPKKNNDSDECENSSSPLPSKVGSGYKRVARNVNDDSQTMESRNVPLPKDTSKEGRIYIERTVTERINLHSYNEEARLTGKNGQTAKDKNLKAIEKLNRKNNQPITCMKAINVHLDKVLQNSEFYQTIVDTLNDSDIAYTIEHRPIPDSITWTRQTEKYFMTDNYEISKKIETQEEKVILIIWDFKMVADRIQEGTFRDEISCLVAGLPDYRKTLIIYKMETYFKNHNELSKRPRKAGLPRITRDDLEKYKVEIEWMLKCNTREVDTARDLAMCVYQYTKAVAEMPFKLDQIERVRDQIDWYAQGDNRNTVKVDKDGHGLKRLWQQQLCQFPSVSLETADAIVSKYPSPAALMQAYDNCTLSQGELLLKDIEIRRAAGPLTVTRKVGPELSKKLYLMYTSEDGEGTLGNNDCKL